jgi:hypothetical protein
MSTRKLTALLALITNLFLPTSAFAQTTNTINLNPAIKYQTITGWEATSQAMHPGQADPADMAANWSVYKDYLIDQVVNDLGINRLRLEVKSGVENSTNYASLRAAGQITSAEWKCARYATVNDDSDPLSVAKNATLTNWPGFNFMELDSKVQNLVLPMQQKLAARGEKLFINLEYVAFTNQITAAGCDPNLKYTHTILNTAGLPDEYAEFMLAASLHLKNKYGIVPDAWEIILEPDNSGHWANNGQIIGKAIKVTGDTLSANGFSNPKFIAPSNTCMGRVPAYYDGIKQTPGALAYVDEIAYHRYCLVSDADLQAIVQRAVADNKKTSMLEWNGGADHNTLHKDLTMGRNSAWQQFTLAFGSTGTPADTGGNYYNLFLSQTTPQLIVQMGSRTKFLRQYFKFIRAGAQRIEATTSNTNFDPVAFINKDGKYVTVVKASAAGTFTINSLAPGSYGIKYTTASQYNIDYPDQNIVAGQSLTTNIPAAGVITIYAKTTSSSPVPSITPSASPSKPGDVDKDGDVDIFDYNILLTDFGKTGTNLASDIEKSGTSANKVDIFDYNLILTNFGK